MPSLPAPFQWWVAVSDAIFSEGGKKSFPTHLSVREIEGSGDAAAGSEDTAEASSNNGAPQTDATEASSTNEETTL